MSAAITLYAAGGVLYRETPAGTEVMLIHRRGVWDLPKGGVEEGESLMEAAIREVMEELGTAQPVAEEFLLETKHYYQLNGQTIMKRTAWYVMTPTSDVFEPQAEEEIDACIWVPLKEAAKLVAFENLREVLKKLESHLRG